jgi:hypothetical protein
MVGEAIDMQFFLFVGRWLLLAIGAKAATSSKAAVIIAKSSNARILLREEPILPLAGRVLSMVDDQLFCEKVIILMKNIHFYQKPIRSALPFLKKGANVKAQGTRIFILAGYFLRTSTEY